LRLETQQNTVTYHGHWPAINRLECKDKPSDGIGISYEMQLLQFRLNQKFHSIKKKKKETKPKVMFLSHNYIFQLANH
jgi:hypothetical protein